MNNHSHRATLTVLLQVKQNMEKLRADLQHQKLENLRVTQPNNHLVRAADGEPPEDTAPAPRRGLSRPASAPALRMTSSFSTPVLRGGGGSPAARSGVPALLSRPASGRVLVRTDTASSGRWGKIVASSSPGVHGGRPLTATVRSPAPIPIHDSPFVRVTNGRLWCCAFCPDQHIDGAESPEHGWPF